MSYGLFDTHRSASRTFFCWVMLTDERFLLMRRFYATRFTTRESAEAMAVFIAATKPEWLGRLEVRRIGG